MLIFFFVHLKLYTFAHTNKFIFMKRLFYTILAITTSISLNAQTQIGNSGFENWENVSGGTEPTNWNSFLTAGGGFAFAAANQLQNSTETRPNSTGTKSVRLNSRETFGIIANGNLTLGKINMGSTVPTNSSNYNASVTSDANFSEALTTLPDSIVFWTKFTPNGHNGNARVSSTIHDNYNYRDPEDANAAPHVVAKAILNFPKTNGLWVRKSVPFVYSGPATSVNFILLTFTTSETAGGGAENDYLWVDDVELIYNPVTFTASTTTGCPGSSINYTYTSNNAFATTPITYAWTFPGGTPATSTAANPSVTYATAGTYDATLTISKSWGSKTVTYSNYITINQPTDPAFNYGQSSYCSNVANPVPTAANPQAFSSTSGLVFANAATGEIDLSASTPGVYTVTNTTSGTCGATATQSITILAGSDASFAYPSNTICMTGSNQIPTITETGGTFTASSAGLVFADANTGEIDIAASTAGTYDVTYTVTGTCPDVKTVSITLTTSPDATFTYANTEYCKNGTDPSPVFDPGANAGLFSSTTGLSINPNSGVIDLSASTAASYSVTNLIAASGSCPAATHSFTVTINDLPNVTLTLPVNEVCTYYTAFSLSGGLPAGGAYSGTGVVASNFDPAAYPSGGTATVTYSYTDATTTCSNSATATIIVDQCLGVENINTLTAITAYPNPTNGILNIDNLKGLTNYSIVSISGQVVMLGELTSNATTIDVSQLQNGVYLLQLHQGENAHTIRIIKQ